MRLRIRGPEGSSAVTLPDTSTTGDLKKSITDATSLQAFEVKSGYPPKSLELDAFNEETSLSETGLKLNGEQLTVVPRQVENPLQRPIKDPPQYAPAVSTPAKAQPAQFPSIASKPDYPATMKPDSSKDSPEIPLPPTHRGKLVLRVMHDDNSCLFRALGSAFFGPSFDVMHELRSIVASAIQSDPVNYSSAHLGKDRDEYCRWIQTDDAWGGAIEIKALAENFNYEVLSIDVKDGTKYSFNEQGSARKRCILVYSGIHYDVIAMSPDGEPENDVKIFDQNDNAVMNAATVLVDQLRQRGYYTDTAGFSIKCTDCGWQGKGEKEAAQHAQDTKHFNLIEV
ncbi:MAG: ubiquitin-specific protease otu1 [Alyxoria varia]|nr:MAG: ubiquitin-specific protease otu1 [Alyxoria varia]